MSNPGVFVNNYSKTERQEIERYESNQESLLQQVRDLRIKTDQLRLENQTLRTELDNFLYLRYLLHRTFKTLKQEIKYSIRQIKKIVVRKLSSKRENTYESDFNPYKVQILHSIQDERPRVLHVIGNFYTGGSARLVVDLIEHLGHKGDKLNEHSDVGALKEIVGDSKLLAPPGDSDTLANIIVELLDDRERRIQIGQLNRQRAQKLFSVEAMIESYSRLYNEMLKLSEVVPNA